LETAVPIEDRQGTHLQGLLAGARQSHDDSWSAPSLEDCSRAPFTQPWSSTWDTVEVGLNRVGKRYTRRGPLVLRDVEMRVPAGALVYVQGDNGCGKSTLMRILARVTVPTRGRVTGLPAQVGYVPERFPPGLSFTPRQYLGHLGRMRGMPGRLVTARGRELLERLGAPAVADTPCSELSKGMCQKVAVAQALLGDPVLLVLDEAFAGLDAAAQAEVMGQVRSRRDTGAAVVFTDHGQRARALIPDVSLLFVAGALQPAATAVPAGENQGVLLVVLVGRPGGFDPVRHDGVRRVEVTAEGMRLHVDAAACDALLTAALAAGLSVRRVEAGW